MNRTLCIATNVEREQNDRYNSEALQDAYATAPVVAVQLSSPSLDEETLHTSFEEAISDRLAAIHKRLSYTSNPQLNSLLAQRVTGPMIPDSPMQSMIFTTVSEKKHYVFIHSWQCRLICICLVLIFMMLGFDLMSLLIFVVK